MDNFRPSGKQINKAEREMLLAQGKKWCAKCQSVKSVEDFFANQYKCKTCSKAAMKNWLSKNPDHLKNWRQENKDHRAAYNKKWEAENKQRCLERRRKYKAKLRATNPKFNIENALRCRLYNKVKNKSSSTFDLLGCSIDYFMNYLEGLFQPGMSWDNYGKWHIDHIRPCASFDLALQAHQEECFHYTNLQPLWAEDNMKKGSSYSETVN